MSAKMRWCKQRRYIFKMTLIEVEEHEDSVDLENEYKGTVSPLTDIEHC